MKRQSQPDLFPRPSRVPGAAQREPVRAPDIKFFDFEREGDAERCLPRPGWIVPEELRLPTDDLE